MIIRRTVITSSWVKLALSLAIVAPTLVSVPDAIAQSRPPQRASKHSSSNQPSSSQTTSSRSTANPSPNASTTSGWGNWLRLFRPPNTGVPSNTGNGSSRDILRCSYDEPLMQPILPAPEDGAYGLTLKARPEVFVEIPHTSAQEALLVFRNEANGDVQRVFLPIPTAENEAAMVSFRLPDESPGLVVGETYQWSLTFICGDYFTLNDPTIIGWVQHQEKTAEIDELLTERSPQAQMEWLGINGYWYDLVDRLANAPGSNP
ncbi:MAG: DUF928 domain-containing protein [Cyanobacteria bacterium P01_F01_bin.150]